MLSTIIALSTFLLFYPSEKKISQNPTHTIEDHNLVHKEDH